jgi:hypothetical protein
LGWGWEGEPSHPAFGHLPPQGGKELRRGERKLLSSRPVVPLWIGSRPARRQAGIRLHLGNRLMPARMALVVLVCAGFSVLAGCSGRGAFLSGGGPTVGQLKTSLSHLEYENSQLKRTVAKLEQEHRSMEDRLVQEEIDNGDLTARLDDARNLLRDRGQIPDDRVRSPRDSLGDSPEGGSWLRTLPAGQSTRRRRKPPVARIPGQIDAPADRDDETSPEPNADPRADRSSLRLDDDLDHHTFYPGPLRWTPSARGADAPTSRVR